MNAPLTPAQREFFLLATQALEEKARRQRQDRWARLFPDEDTVQPDGSLIHARRKYAKHLEFFRAGATYRERCAMAANRVGKTYGMGGYEIVTHLTGIYPHWWEGRRFTRPIKAWAAGKTNETTRDIIQFELMGELHKRPDGRRFFDGTGLIPGKHIGGLTFKKGGSDLIDVVKIRHASGGWSRLGLKSYEQGRGAFEGTAQHVIWLDEEPPIEIYGECLIRTATTGGITMLTFTPLDGISETVMQFMDGMDRETDA
ncbi:terminase family protein [Phaeobacter gallaeciensis]|uniref:terminase large subunit domain-containing protein n=1 Tax=Phaeobacter gallaeciensis TaxID=60890 RepID=UPI00237F003A|nr:terminase family protein [Phaeobacter gallaeciensis]MDE4303619.1 terminase family protein [Phaeobacter gallaeciensis]MDE4307899.1 terminase family protein [Phaeobacter gallaeciensis]MDE4312357.1 terminase family protein [Phaeobacter gallaeciensis]MDE4316828.1 terminase family protein [Phaeobacter gallaeciensis]MDE4321291.1 terminase family protein [Phaeobacter gallaeciensis]